MLIVVAYDITDNKRRSRVAKVLEGYGYRVQESIFECHLDTPLLENLRNEIEKVIDLDEDLVRYYTLCAKDTPDIRLAGNTMITGDALFYSA